ncbi:PspA/IM30 family protein [Nocardia sp. NPDC059177]|uniref:PspA/IM30 family protein n=1 Tax=Nocardia sp. NPDC059177 TaxID=3346759 RepID=UPI0036B27BEE
MSETSEILGRLAALPDAELVTVLRAAVAGRPGLVAVAAALSEVETGHAETGAPVNLDTAIVDAHVVPAASEQVGATFPVPPVPHGLPGPVAPAATGGYSSSGVPTFDSVRDKVEQRFGTAQGMDELDRQTPAGRSADEQWEAREKAARERLDQIRKSMHRNDSGADGT